MKERGVTSLCFLFKDHYPFVCKCSGINAAAELHFEGV